MCANIQTLIKRNALSGLGSAKRASAMLYGAWALHIKKTLHHPKADAAARHAFRQKIEAYQAQGRTVVYIDESGFAHDMPRQYGYALAGQRCLGTCDWHAKGRTNVIGALIGKSLLTVGLVKSNVNADIFYQWTVQDLLPKLPASSVIVMDNATFHKRQDIRAAIVNAGHLLVFLPPYSPDLNPIEKKWAQAKKLRKKLRCSIPQLFKIESFYLA
jgi:transposase